MDKRLELSTKLKEKSPSSLKMIVGLDGFVDEIIHVVDKRLDPETFKRMNTIEDYAKRIEGAIGLSTNIELFVTDTKIGGNGPIMANALAQHEGTISLIGALGSPSIHEVFLPLKDKISLYSICNPGHTDALEFDDGKLIIGKMAHLKDVNYDNFITTVGLDHLKKILKESDMFAMTNWSMLTNLTDLWKRMIDELLPNIAFTKKGYLFVDLADPEKRENVEIKEALDLLKYFRPYFKVVLGLNKKEAYDVADVLGLFDHESLKNMQISLEDLNQALYNYLELDVVVIHPVDRSCCVTNGTFYEEIGPYVKKPKLSTGAGDNFNAGFMLGLLLDLSPDDALLTGMSTSGFYVRNAKSPNFEDLQSFLVDWTNDQL
jgi:hypothetical protein